MSDDGDMSDDELDALISDLEGRDGGGGSAGGGEMPEEEVDDFLQQLEEDQTSDEPSTTAVAEEPEADAGPDLSDLEGTDELPVETDESASAPEGESSEELELADDESSGGTSSDGEESDDAPEQSSESNGWKYAWLATKWTGFVVPVLALWWLVGAFLGQWVSAGWLIFLTSGMFVFGLPKVAYDASKQRGHYRWWLSGMALLLTIALTAPISGTAGEVLAGYGHWPGTVLVEVFGTDLGIGSAIGRFGEFLGTQIAPGLSDAAVDLDLGSNP